SVGSWNAGVEIFRRCASLCFLFVHQVLAAFRSSLTNLAIGTRRVDRQPVLLIFCARHVPIATPNLRLPNLLRMLPSQMKLGARPRWSEFVGASRGSTRLYIAVPVRRSTYLRRYVRSASSVR